MHFSNLDADFFEDKLKEGSSDHSPVLAFQDGTKLATRQLPPPSARLRLQQSAAYIPTCLPIQSPGT